MGNCSSKDEGNARHGARPRFHDAVQAVGPETTRARLYEDLDVNRGVLRDAEAWKDLVQEYGHQMNRSFANDENLTRREKPPMEPALNIHHASVRRLSKTCEDRVWLLINTLPPQAYEPRPEPACNQREERELLLAIKSAVWAVLKQDVGRHLLHDFVTAHAPSHTRLDHLALFDARTLPEIEADNSLNSFSPPGSLMKPRLSPSRVVTSNGHSVSRSPQPEDASTNAAPLPAAKLNGHSERATSSERRSQNRNSKNSEIARALGGGSAGDDDEDEEEEEEEENLVAIELDVNADGDGDSSVHAGNDGEASSWWGGTDGEVSPVGRHASKAGTPHTQNIGAGAQKSKVASPASEPELIYAALPSTTHNGKDDSVTMHSALSNNKTGSPMLADASPLSRRSQPPPKRGRSDAGSDIGPSISADFLVRRLETDQSPSRQRSLGGSGDPLADSATILELQGASPGELNNFQQRAPPSVVAPYANLNYGVAPKPRRTIDGSSVDGSPSLARSGSVLTPKSKLVATFGELSQVFQPLRPDSPQPGDVSTGRRLEPARSQLDTCFLTIPLPKEWPKETESLRDETGRMVGVTQMKENGVVYFWNGNINLQFHADIDGVAPGADADTRFDEKLKKEVTSIVVFPGEKRAACKYNEAGFPRTRWYFESLSDEYIEWKKSEREQYIYEAFQRISAVVEDDWEEPEVLDTVVEKKQMFVDLWFLPGTQSLQGSSPKEGRRVAESIEKCGWTRQYLPPDSRFLKVLFDSKPEARHIDLFSSPLGNRWLLCVMGALCELPGHPKLNILKAIFALSTAPMQSVGAYKVTLCKDGWWTVVIIDDILPMYHNSPAFAVDKTGVHVQWVPLLEKAFAKLCGGYAALMEGGAIDEPLADLSGFPVKSYAGELWTDSKDIMLELMAEWQERKYLMMFATHSAGDDGEADTTADKLVKRFGLDNGCGYAVESTHDGAVTVLNPWAADSSQSKVTIDWKEAYQVFAGLSVCFVEPDYRELRVMMPVDPSGVIFPFGMQIDLNEGVAPVRFLIHAHQRDIRLDPELEDPSYGVMMVTVLGHLGGSSWVKCGVVNEWGPRDMLFSVDDEDADPGLLLDSSVYQRYFIAWHMHPKERCRHSIVAALHYDSVQEGEFGTVTFKENSGWDYTDGNIKAEFDSDELKPVEAYAQKRERYCDAVDAGVVSCIGL
ncbi:Calpain-D [Diplonema papillatum]|nr:Calpain-D [Diplonema papillatum]